jgi:hypothetical protein
MMAIRPEIVAGRRCTFNVVEKTSIFAGTLPTLMRTVTAQSLRIERLEYGGRTPVNDNFNRLIDFSTIWSRALSADEVSSFTAIQISYYGPQAICEQYDPIAAMINPISI